MSTERAKLVVSLKALVNYILTPIGSKPASWNQIPVCLEINPSLSWGSDPSVLSDQIPVCRVDLIPVRRGDLIPVRRGDLIPVFCGIKSQFASKDDALSVKTPLQIALVYACLSS